MADQLPAQNLQLLLAGDVMTGRGIDQILQHPGDPILYESWARSALRYVELAEQRNGPIPKGVEPEYVWGEALEILGGADARIINLETTVTDHFEPWPGKGIHYRMHPDNVDTIKAAGIDCCVLANNHTLDWSYPGLSQSLATLHDAGLAASGAGRDIGEASQPAIIDTESGTRVVVVSVGSTSSGIPRSWAASRDRPGVFLTDSLSRRNVGEVAAKVSTAARSGDVVIVSIHWGPNWGYDIPVSHRRFAHQLIDDAGAHIVHGHSSHHPIGIEVYRGRLILYGCGDLINDYEGIAGHKQFHPDLSVVYLLSVASASGRLQQLDLVPLRMRRFRLERAPPAEIMWLQETMTRECLQFDVRVENADEKRLRAVW